MKYYFNLLFLLSCNLFCIGQSLFGIDVVYQDSNVSFRGLSVVDNAIIWASGSKGTVVKSVDGGLNFKAMKVADCSTCDFRDIEAFDGQTAIIMASGTPAKVFKTIDGGQTWKLVLYDTVKAAFFDGMDFTTDGKIGFIFGDPIVKKKNQLPFFEIYKTINNGDTWQRIKVKQQILQPGEASFASSGTGICSLENKTLAIVSGGKASHIYILDQNGQRIKRLSPPIIQGKESTGINSIAISPNQQKLIVVGGDFSEPKQSANNCFTLDWKGKRESNFNFIAPIKGLSGYKSCVTFLSNFIVFATGTSGTDVSMDAGMNWQKMNDVSFHVCKLSKKEKLFVFAGSKGKIGLFKIRRIISIDFLFFQCIP